MQDSSNSPPNAGDTQDIVFSPTRPSNQQEKAPQSSRNKRRKDKGSELEQDNVNKSNNDIPDSGSVPNTPREANVSTVDSVDGIDSPPSSMEEDYTPMAHLFNAWNVTKTPQERD
jgi:hypothetical protein